MPAHPRRIGRRPRRSPGLRHGPGSPLADGPPAARRSWPALGNPRRAKTLTIDKEFRTYGFGRAADRDATLLEPEAAKITEAYSRGVNKFIEQHQKNLPLEFSLLNYKPQPWKPSDTLAISGYMYRTLTDTWQRELNRAKVTERAGPERAKDLFFEEAALDHFVVGDPKVLDDGSQRSAADDDEDDDDDLQPDTVLKAQSR